MATAKPHSIQPRRGMLRRFAPWLGLAVFAWLALYWPTLHRLGMTGAAYGARVGCSCHFVAGRSLSDCRKDFEPGMELVMLSADAEGKSVTARFPLVASQTASLQEGAGCVLEKWED